MEEYNNPNKVYIDVLAAFNQEGELRPLAIKWEDGRRYSVDRVIDVRQASSLKAGGTGIRYSCVVCGKQTYLFFEEGRWWVERK